MQTAIEQLCATIQKSFELSNEEIIQELTSYSLLSWMLNDPIIFIYVMQSYSVTGYRQYNLTWSCGIPLSRNLSRYLYETSWLRNKPA